MPGRLDPRIPKRIFELFKEVGDKREKWGEISDTVNKEFGTNYNRVAAANIYKRYKHGQTAPDHLLPHDEAPQEANGFLERVAEIIQTSKKVPKNPPIGYWCKWFREAQGLRDSVSDRELQATAEINAKEPIAISWLGDWHLGSPHTNYEKLYGDVEFIKSNPRLYCCISGDRTDMFVPGFKDAAAVTGQLVPGDLQLDAMEAILRELGDSIVCAIGGNHDAMAKKKTGVDTERWVRRGMKFSYMPHGGLLTLKVGTQEYKILWKHTYKFQSALNKFNSHHRMMELLEPLADVVVQEHLHDPGMESIEKLQGGKRHPVVSIRTGAYKEDDAFSLDWYKQGLPAPQTVIFYPDRHKVLAMHGAESMQDAAIYLKGIRKNG